MSDADASAVASAYVREMLDLNPVSQSAQIIRRRRELWRPNEKPRSPVAQAIDPQTSAKLRERAKQCLDALQRSFYNLPAEKVEQYLAFLEQERLPEFAVQAARFRQVFIHRDALIQLDRALPDRKFAYSLLHGLIKPAAESGALHEQYIEAIRHEKRIKPATRMIREVVQRYPALYVLEQSWLDAILSVRPKKRAHQQNGISFQQVAGVVAGVTLLVVFTIIMSSSDKNRSNNYRKDRYRSTYQPPIQPTYQPPVTYPATTDTPTDSFNIPSSYSTKSSREYMNEIIERNRRQADRARQDMEERMRALTKPPSFDPPQNPYSIPDNSVPSYSPPSRFNGSPGNSGYQRPTFPSAPEFN